MGKTIRMDTLMMNIFNVIVYLYYIHDNNERVNWFGYGLYGLYAIHGEKKTYQWNLSKLKPKRKQKQAIIMSIKEKYRIDWTKKSVALSSQLNNRILIDFLIDKNGYGFILFSFLIWDM